MNKSEKNYSEEQKETVRILKKHLKSLRLIAGWKPKELAEIVGLSQQTILGFENDPDTNISYIQCIALIAVFEQKAMEDDSESLKAILNLLFDQKDKYNSNKEEIDNNITLLAGAAGAACSIGAISGPAIAAFAAPIFGPLGGIAVLAGGAASLISSIVLKKNKNK